jgi:hypothetical protein
MVDVTKINQLLKKHFRISGKVNVDLITGMVDVDGSVELKSQLTKLPIRFGQVSGDFDCSLSKLKSLEGAPDSVGKNFYCRYNQLKSLEGAPDSVGEHFWCSNNKLASLNGAPTSVGGEFWVDYTESLPLLRLLQYNNIRLHKWAPNAVITIMNKYAGTGKAFMLNCALELKQAGFEGNAAW